MKITNFRFILLIKFSIVFYSTGCISGEFFFSYSKVFFKKLNFNVLSIRMPHKCHGNGQNCPTRSHAVWEMVMNELDRRDDPSFDEELSGCSMVDQCANIISGKFIRFSNN